MNADTKPSGVNRIRRSKILSSSAVAAITVLLLSEPVNPPLPMLDVDIALTNAFTGIIFSGPVLMKQPPGDDSRFMVVEQGGTIQVVLDGVKQGTPFLNISTRVRGPLQNEPERGLLGLAFDPDYPSTNSDYVYVSYTSESDADYPRPGVIPSMQEGETVVSRFTLMDDGGSPDLNRVDETSEVIILRQVQFEVNHNGGNIDFGPDGFLYIGLGDGGGQGDPQDNGQDTSNYLGSMLRIDVNSLPYSIPASNPYINETCATNCPEIFAYGLRNPWRWSFDDFGAGKSNDLWLGDVGQSRWEEVDRVVLGGNYGWDCREGPIQFMGDSSMECGSGSYLNPVTSFSSFSQSPDCSVTGGFVYRGSAIPELAGSFLYGDYCSGKIRAFPYYTAFAKKAVELLDTAHSISTFARDNLGELYLADLGSGIIYKIVAGPGDP